MAIWGQLYKISLAQGFYLVLIFQVCPKGVELYVIELYNLYVISNNKITTTGNKKKKKNFSLIQRKALNIDPG